MRNTAEKSFRDAKSKIKASTDPVMYSLLTGLILLAQQAASTQEAVHRVEQELDALRRILLH
jgi:hypothetical protein